MTYYIDMNDGRGPKMCRKQMWNDALVSALVKYYGYRYRMRDTDVTILEKRFN
jgi:hypothetical protein